MTYEKLKQLEDGTLITIKGVGALGLQVDKLICSKSDYVHKSGLMFGSTLYPLEWVEIATQDDFFKAVNRACEDFKNTLERLKNAWDKAKKFRG